MRLALALILVAGVVSAAPSKELKPYAGQVVLSPDTPPTSFSELPGFLKINFDKSHHYESLKWDVNFVGVLAKPADKVTLIVSDPSAKPDAGTTATSTPDAGTTARPDAGPAILAPITTRAGAIR